MEFLRFPRSSLVGNMVKVLAEGTVFDVYGMLKTKIFIYKQVLSARRYFCLIIKFIIAPTPFDISKNSCRIGLNMLCDMMNKNWIRLYQKS